MTTNIKPIKVKAHIAKQVCKCAYKTHATYYYKDGKLYFRAKWYAKVVEVLLLPYYLFIHGALRFKDVMCEIAEVCTGEWEVDMSPAELDNLAHILKREGLIN